MTSQQSGKDTGGVLLIVLILWIVSEAFDTFSFSFFGETVPPERDSEATNEPAAEELNWVGRLVGEEELDRFPLFRWLIHIFF